jgi:propanol-preferring alcohol dehydrogenase
MRAWQVSEQGPADTGPLTAVELPEPEPAASEVRVAIQACGVCRTDLHIAEGDLPLHKQPVVPGHEIVGVVDKRGPGATRFEIGDRIGIAWLRHTDGTCRFCLRQQENLCLAPAFTGWDTDGGFAEAAVVDEAYAYRIPDVFAAHEAAPLLCAGIIGFRALRRANLPRGGRLGIWGFGASAHLAAQVALAEGAEVHVRTRAPAARELARQLGATSVGDSYDPLDEPLDGAVLFAPVGDLVPAALSTLDRGATLAIAGIYLTDIPTLNYEAHLFEERTLQSVTANTRADGEEFLRIAAEVPLRITTSPYSLDDAPQALRDLAADRVEGAAVLLPNSP